MSKFIVNVGGRQYEVEVYEETENMFVVKIGGREYVVHLPQEVLQELENPIAEISERLSRAIEESIPRLQLQPLSPVEEPGYKIVSEIPGRLVKIVVKEGDFVDVGQTIAALESMKMVIEIKSPYRGKVKKILGKEGSFIDVGQTIAILQPV